MRYAELVVEARRICAHAHALEQAANNLKHADMFQAGSDAVQGVLRLMQLAREDENYKSDVDRWFEKIHNIVDTNTANFDPIEHRRRRG
jgi:hypothetical protein